MQIILAEAALDENGQTGYEPHLPGNQNGQELRNKEYYNKPWQFVLRAKNPDVARDIATRCQQAVDNRHVGYGQPGRNEFIQAVRVDADPSHIKKDMDTDCSGLVSGCTWITLKLYGLDKPCMNGYETTYYMPDHYMQTGAFDNVTSTIDLSTGAGLKRGDILIRQKSHTAIVSKVIDDYSKVPKWVGRITTTTSVVTAPSKNAPKLTAYPTVYTGNLVDVCDSVDGFYYIRIAGKYFGFVPQSTVVNNDIFAMKPAPQPAPPVTIPTEKWVSGGIDYSPVFNPQYYLDKYADLKKTFGSDYKKAFEHFLSNGMKEARQASVDFNPVYYKNTNADVAKAMGKNWPKYYLHYLQFGMKEGRKGCEEAVPATPKPAEPTYKIGTVTTPLYCRIRAGKEYGYLSVFAKDTKIRVLGLVKDKNGDDWCEVQLENTLGYCLAKFVQF